MQHVSCASQYVNKSFISGAPSVALESVMYVLAICVTDVYQFLKRLPCNFRLFYEISHFISFMPFTAY